MYAVEVRDHVMIAHSLPDPVFGPAQGLHGATYVVDAAFFADDARRARHRRRHRPGDGRARGGAGAAALRQPRRRCRRSPGGSRTTEVLCRHVFDALAAAVRAGRLGGGGRPSRLRVTLHESHVARAWYEADL